MRRPRRLDDGLFRCASLLLRHLLPARDLTILLSELRELNHFRIQREGRQFDLWLLRQLLYGLLYFSWERARLPLSRFSTRWLSLQEDTSAMHHLFQDARQSLRSLTRTPAVTFIIVITVGLAIGANTAIFSLIQGVLLSPLSYPEPERLVQISMQAPPDNRWPLSVVDYRALDSQQTVFRDVAGFRNSTATFRRGDLVERVRGKFVTWDYFRLLGISPILGRPFSESDDRPGAPASVLISHFFWQNYLQGLPSVIGEAIQLDGENYQIVGVLPARMGALETDRHFFAVARWPEPQRRGPFFIHALGRLKPGVSKQAAQEELHSITEALFPVWASSFQSREATWGQQDLKETLVGDLQPTLFMAFGAVLLVFLIASVNAANLLIARAGRRRRELAVRSALGASKIQLLQNLLAENLWLALGASILAGIVASLGIDLLRTLGSGYFPRAQEIHFGGPVQFFFLGSVLVSLCLFGLIPSLGLAAAPSRLAALRTGERSATGSRRLHSLRRVLVMAEIAIALPLLIAGSLLASSLAKLGNVDPGFDPESLLTLQVSLPNSYREAASIEQFWREAIERVNHLPGVVEAGFSDGRPPAEISQSNNFDLLDKPTPAGGTQPATPWVAVSPEYFGALEVPLLKGRLLQESDNPQAPPVVVVDKAWADRFFPGEETVGRRFYSGGCTTCPPVTVVGVVGTVKYSGLDKLEAGTVYWSMSVSPAQTGYLMVRTRGNPLAVLPSIREVIRDIDSGLPISRVATGGELLTDALQSPRYLTALMVVFGGTSLLLSLVGIYGVMLYFVQQQNRDIGVRMAVGATRLQVLGLVVGNTFRLVLWGALGGLLLAAGLTHFMSSLLFQVSTLDPVAFGVASSLTLLAALAASLFPAWKASTVDPVQALRSE